MKGIGSYLNLADKVMVGEIEEAQKDWKLYRAKAKRKFYKWLDSCVEINGGNVKYIKTILIK